MNNPHWGNLSVGDQVIHKPTKQAYVVSKVVKGQDGMTKEFIGFRTLSQPTTMAPGVQKTEAELVRVTGNSQDWSYVAAKNRKKMAISGGFVVKRAATGKTEYEPSVNNAR